MCFVNTTGKIRIATKDITCYKTLENDMCSVFWSHEYKIDDIQDTVRLNAILINGTYYVEKGYHSYKEENEARLRCIAIKKGRKAVKCIIPKGSKYLYSKRKKEYVSSNIIAKEVL